MILTIPSRLSKVAVIKAKEAESNPNEFSALKESLTIQVMKFRGQGAKPRQVDICYLRHLYIKDKDTGKNIKYYYVPLGLVNKSFVYMKSKGFNLSIPNIDKFKGYQVTTDELNEFYDTKLFLPDYFERYEWQIEAVRQILNSKFSSAEVSVSGGKTFLSFFIMRYIKEYPERFGIKNKNPRMMVVVPQTNLATQNCLEYRGFDKDNTFKIEALFHGSDYVVENDEADISVVTYQTAVIKDGQSKEDFEEEYQKTHKKKPSKDLVIKQQSWFDQFDVVIVDEMQFARSISIKSILSGARKARFVTGMTGTYPDIDLNKEDFHEIMCFLGAKIRLSISLKFLQEIGQTTKIKITQHHIKYGYEIKSYSEKLLDPHIKYTGTTGVRNEKEAVYGELSRVDYVLDNVADCMERMEMNHLISFVEKGMGKLYYGEAVKRFGVENVHFINGEIVDSKKDAKRLNVLKKFEAGKKQILVGSVGTMAIGVNTKTVQSIHAVEPRVTFYSVLQLIGRQARKHGEKGFAEFHDYVDIPRLPKGALKRKYYLKSNGRDRLKIYDKQQQPYQIVNKILNQSKGRVELDDYKNIKIK